MYKETQLAGTAAPKAKSAELRSIQNRISAVFKTRPNKIPRCSAYIKAQAAAGMLNLIFRHEMSDHGRWSVCEPQAVKKKIFPQTLYSSSGLAGLTGWLDVNKLHLNPQHSITLDTASSHISSSQALQFIQKAFHFLDQQPSSPQYEVDNPSWSKVLVAVECAPSGGSNSYERFDIIIKNTWGEIFHHDLALKDIENNMLKCYKLSNHVYTLVKEKSSRNLQFCIVSLDADTEEYAQKTTLDFFHQLGAKPAENSINAPGKDHSSTSDKIESENPFLDRL